MLREEVAEAAVQRRGIQLKGTEHCCRRSGEVREDAGEADTVCLHGDLVEGKGLLYGFLQAGQG